MPSVAVASPPISTYHVDFLPYVAPFAQDEGDFPDDGVLERHHALEQAFIVDLARFQVDVGVRENALDRAVLGGESSIPALGLLEDLDGLADLQRQAETGVALPVVDGCEPPEIYFDGFIGVLAICNHNKHQKRCHTRKYVNTHL